MILIIKRRKRCCSSSAIGAKQSQVMTFLALTFSMSVICILHKKLTTRNADDWKERELILPEPKTPTSRPEQTTPQPLAACLLVKDDNNILPEWLAFHYTVAPLRRLILAVDPEDRVPPDHIVDAYREIGLETTVWRLPQEKVWRPPEDKRRKTGYDLHLRRHNIRQKTFMARCMKKLKSENYTWTLMIDSDEYVTLNNYNSDERHFDCENLKNETERRSCYESWHHNMQAGKLNRSRLPVVGEQNSTLSHVLSGLTRVSTALFEEFPCIYLPRVLFAPKKSMHTTLVPQVPNGFSPQKYRTVRDRFHGKWQNEMPGKSIVDVSRYQGESVVNPHRVLMNRCNCKSVFVRFYNALFRVHHYTGTLDEYLFRPGYINRNVDEYKKRVSKAFKNGSVNSDLIGWLAEFSRLVGKDKAVALTESLIDWSVREYGALSLANDSSTHESLSEGKIYGSSIATIANKLLRTKGVVVRVPDGVDSSNMRYYLPAAFVHASMRAPNVMYREDERHVATVGILTATKFNRLSQDKPAGKNYSWVDCRAYYPTDAYSFGIGRNHSLSNPLGSSCSAYQSKHEFKLNKIPIYNITAGCSCNPSALLDRDFAEYLLAAENKGAGKNKVNCWFHGTEMGIEGLLAASNSLYLNRLKFKPRPRTKRFVRLVSKGGVEEMNHIVYYQGWTECSASPSIQDTKMMDALVIGLPHAKNSHGGMISSIGDLDSEQLQDLLGKLKKLTAGGKRHLPILVLEERQGMDAEECTLFWGGSECTNGYRKEFNPRTFVFDDGSRLAQANGDNEVRFYPSSRGSEQEMKQTNFGS